MTQFFVSSKTFPTEMIQVLSDPTAAWENGMIIAFATKNILDSFCLEKNEACGARS